MINHYCVLSTANLLSLADFERMFNFTVNAKTLYEINLKLYKNINYTLFSSPNILIAGSLLGLGSIFLSDSRDELAIRIFEESLVCLRVLYQHNHFTIYTTIILLIRTIQSLCKTEEIKKTVAEKEIVTQIIKRYNTKLITLFEELVVFLRYNIKEIKYIQAVTVKLSNINKRRAQQAQA